MFVYIIWFLWRINLSILYPPHLHSQHTKLASPQSSVCMSSILRLVRYWCLILVLGAKRVRFEFNFDKKVAFIWV